MLCLPWSLLIPLTNDHVGLINSKRLASANILEYSKGLHFAQMKQGRGSQLFILKVSWALGEIPDRTAHSRGSGTVLPPQGPTSPNSPAAGASTWGESWGAGKPLTASPPRGGAWQGPRSAVTLTSGVLLGEGAQRTHHMTSCGPRPQYLPSTCVLQVGWTAGQGCPLEDEKPGVGTADSGVGDGRLGHCPLTCLRQHSMGHGVCHYPGLAVASHCTQLSGH